MKNISLILLILGLCSGSCKRLNINAREKPNPHAAEIVALIAQTGINESEELNVKNLGGAPTLRTLKNENKKTDRPVKGEVYSCVTKDYNLQANFDEVAILRPTDGIIWPGALVYANQGMLDGLPNPMTFSRSPVTLRIDLPGMGEKGEIVVKNPSNSNIQTAKDNALEWWNANAYEDGYVNASNSSYQSTTSYSSKQMSLDVGLNLEWATGSVASQLDYASSETKRVATMVYKQVFYAITMDTPENPSSVFGSDVTTEQLKAGLDSSGAPAYVSSVSYGRIIMFRMESTDSRQSIELDAVLEYAAGASGTSTVNSTYDEILKNSKISVVTIGGNAEVSSEAVNATSAGSLKSIITGKNAVYSRNNPGVPIAYTIRYLKDNSVAKLGYTTDYKVTTCGRNAFEHKNAKVRKTLSNTVRFRFTYLEKGTQNFKKTNWVEIDKDNVFEASRPPAGAHDVNIQFEALDVIIWSSAGEIKLDYLESEECFEAYCASSFIVCTSWSVKRVNCN